MKISIKVYYEKYRGQKVAINIFILWYSVCDHSVLPLLLDHACSAPDDLYQPY